MRESSSIRAHSGPPGTSNEAGWARLRGLSRWPQCPPAASTVQSQATEQEESSILSWSHTPHSSRHTWTGRLSGGRRKSYSQRLRRRRWKAYRLSDASAGCPPCAGQHFFQAPSQPPCIQGQESLLLWANSEPGVDTGPSLRCICRVPTLGYTRLLPASRPTSVHPRTGNPSSLGQQRARHGHRTKENDT